MRLIERHRVSENEAAANRAYRKKIAFARAHYEPLLAQARELISASGEPPLSRARRFAKFGSPSAVYYALAVAEETKPVDPIVGRELMLNASSVYVGSLAKIGGDALMEARQMEEPDFLKLQGDLFLNKTLTRYVF